MPANRHFRWPPVAELMPIPNPGVHVRKVDEACEVRRLAALSGTVSSLTGCFHVLILIRQ